MKLSFVVDMAAQSLGYLLEIDQKYAREPFNMLFSTFIKLDYVLNRVHVFILGVPKKVVF